MLPLFLFWCSCLSFCEPLAGVLPSEQCLLVVDAPTSKAKIPIDMLKAGRIMMENGKLLKEQASVLVPTGQRLDLLVAIANAMEVEFPDSERYTTQLNKGSKQSVHGRPTYCHFGASAPKVTKAAPGKVPTSIGGSNRKLLIITY